MASRATRGGVGHSSPLLVPQPSSPPPLPVPPTPAGTVAASTWETMSVSRDSLVHAVAGGVGSALALALFYPLDQLRTYQQVDDKFLGAQCGSRYSILTQYYYLRELIDRQGTGVLYRGLLPMLVSALKRYRGGGMPALSSLDSRAERVPSSILSRAWRKGLQDMVGGPVSCVSPVSR
jgi:hypothetical protein